jgi:hypothetical protein
MARAYPKNEGEKAGKKSGVTSEEPAFEFRKVLQKLFQELESLLFSKEMPVVESLIFRLIGILVRM